MKLDREYVYSPERLARELGLAGAKVIRVGFADGVWSVWTREEPK